MSSQAIFAHLSDAGSLMQLPRRVVITGIGMITPYGLGAELAWQKLLAGESGLSKITRFDISEYPTKIAGTLPNLDFAKLLSDVPELRRMDTMVAMSLLATKEALSQANL